MAHAFAILTLALACQSRAAPEQPPQADPAGPTPSYAESGLPWQVPEVYLTEKNLYAICNSQLLFVGTIVEADSFRANERLEKYPDVASNIILTEAIFDVERKVVGDPGSRFTEVMTGGAVKDGKAVASHSPYPGMGRRYALALSKVEPDLRDPFDDSWKSWGIDAWIAIDPDAPLPSECRLRLERDRICHR